MSYDLRGHRRKQNGKKASMPLAIRQVKRVTSVGRFASRYYDPKTGQKRKAASA